MVEDGTIEDGLAFLREQFSLRDIASLIASSAKWVDRQTFHRLPVWHPELARRDILYSANWSKPSTDSTKKEPKRESNVKAMQTLTRALGQKGSGPSNWTCCHIWGVDDPKFQKRNTIVQDKRFYCCTANMILLPTPLKAFTDGMEEIKCMLTVASAACFGWPGGHDDTLRIEFERGRCSWEHYPSCWPREETDEPPQGVFALNQSIESSIDTRVKRIHRDLETAGEFYPRDEVRKVLRYWAEAIPSFGDDVRKRGML